MTRLRVCSLVTGLTLALGLPATAMADVAYTTTAVNLRAGPDAEYPLVRWVPEGTQVEVHGCLGDFRWCDVEVYGDRGWMFASYLIYSYQNQRLPIITYGPTIGLPILGFSIDYWDNYYSHRPWYQDRSRWAGRYRPEYRPDYRPERRPDYRPPQYRPPQPRPPQYYPPGVQRPRDYPPNARPPLIQQPRPPLQRPPDYRPPDYRPPAVQPSPRPDYRQPDVRPSPGYRPPEVRTNPSPGGRPQQVSPPPSARPPPSPRQPSGRDPQGLRDNSGERGGMNTGNF